MDVASRPPSTSVERVEAAHRLLTVKEAAAEMRVSPIDLDRLVDDLFLFATGLDRG